MTGPSARLRRTGLLVVALLVTLTGCGPEHSVKLGVRNVSTDILLKTATPPAAPPDQPSLPPGFPFVPPPAAPPVLDGSIPLPPPLAELPPTPPKACPVAGPYASAAVAAPRRPSAPPAAKTYNVRVGGTYAITGGTPSSGRYGPAGTRTVAAPTELPQEAGWSYTVSDEQGLTTAYQVIPEQLGQSETPVESANQPTPTQAGIYVTSFVYERADTTKLTLTPQPALMVAKLPFTAGDRWSSHAVDAQTGISIVLNGQTGLGAKYNPFKARVDACGQVLDAYWVEYTVDTTPANDAVGNQEPPSQLSGPDLLMQFVGSKVAFGPQYGGLPVEELYTLKGTDKDTTVDIRRHAVYSTEPARVGTGTG
ncbi:MAG: hypothetical protein JJD92_02100 [Frankiaceae bacterium]|nr:hypothetical protein [Frankiaceae bacterium]